MRRKLSKLSTEERKLYDSLKVEISEIRGTLRKLNRRKSLTILEMEEYYDKVFKLADLIHRRNHILYNLDCNCGR
jgi:hypothetical protein